MDKELMLLSYDDCHGKNKLEVLEQFGLSAGITDFCILTGGCKENRYKTVDEWKSDYYLSSVDELKDLLYNNHVGKTCHIFYPTRAAGCRPVLNYIPDNLKQEDFFINEKGVLEVKYLEYPNKIVDNNIGRILEGLHNCNELKNTQKIYTLDGEVNVENYRSDFIPKDYAEYLFNNKKYVRMRAKLFKDDETLSDGTLVKDNDIVWVEVLPVNWLVDIKTNKLICKYSLQAGIKLDKMENNFKEDFRNTEMYNYLNKYMLPQLLMSDIRREDFNFVNHKIK